MGMVPKYPRIFGNRFRFILVPKYSTTPAYTGETQMVVRLRGGVLGKEHACKEAGKPVNEPIYPSAR